MNKVIKTSVQDSEIRVVVTKPTSGYRNFNSYTYDTQSYAILNISKSVRDEYDLIRVWYLREVEYSDADVIERDKEDIRQVIDDDDDLEIITDVGNRCEVLTVLTHYDSGHLTSQTRTVDSSCNQTEDYTWQEYDEITHIYTAFIYRLGKKSGLSVGRIVGKINDRPNHQRDNVTVSRGVIVDDRMVGDWYHYFPDNERHSITYYYDGLRNGPYHLYDVDKVLLTSGHYINDMRFGPWLKLDPVTGVTTRGSYVSNKQHGVWISTDNAGKVISRTHYSCEHEEHEDDE